MAEKWMREIKPKTGLFDVRIHEVIEKKDLILLLVRREFVAKYKQTILGPAWAIIQPLLTTVVFTLIFGNLAGLAASGVPSFVFYLSGTIIWTYFANCLTHTSNTFIENREILSKVYFPRLVMPVSTVISQCISFAIQFLFMLCFVFVYWVKDAGVEPNIAMLLTPILIFQLAMLGMGFGIIISALTTKYRDLAMLVTFGVQLWQYASPIAYDISIIPQWFMVLYQLNPIRPIVLVFRYAFLGLNDVNWLFYGISWITTVFVFAIGVIKFNSVEKTFVDTV